MNLLFSLVLINILLVSTVVIIHNFSLYYLAKLIPLISFGNLKLVAGVIGALVAHAVEIWVFALAYFLMCQNGAFGMIEGAESESLLDYVYFSFTTYSTLGYGDLIPIGLLRYVAGIESLTGLVIVTWTASFLFIEMKRFWNIDEEAEEG